MKYTSQQLLDCPKKFKINSLLSGNNQRVLNLYSTITATTFFDFILPLLRVVIFVDKFYFFHTHFVIFVFLSIIYMIGLFHFSFLNKIPSSDARCYFLTGIHLIPSFSMTKPFREFAKPINILYTAPLFLVKLCRFFISKNKLCFFCCSVYVSFLEKNLLPFFQQNNCTFFHKSHCFKTQIYKLQTIYYNY